VKGQISGLRDARPSIIADPRLGVSRWSGGGA